jgi:subtilisin family serine protease
MSETSGIGEPRSSPARNLRTQLAKSRIGLDLLDALNAVAPPDDGDVFDVLIEGDARFPGGAANARLELARRFVLDKADLPNREAILGDLEARGISLRPSPQNETGGPEFAAEDRLDLANSFWTEHFLIGRLTRRTILALAQQSADSTTPRVYKVWLNHQVHASVFESVRTVKCDAARTAFTASGDGIVWAIADTGIDREHPHFATHGTLDLPQGLQHHDFTAAGDALADTDGHGTHVAGIIAGETVRGAPLPNGHTTVDALVVTQEVRTSETDTNEVEDRSRMSIAGIAPLCKLLSLRVLNDRNAGDVGLLLAAIGYIQAANNYGRELKIHGVNFSLGYTFDPQWFAAGQSPLCVEVDRLVKSGVVVVVAAGNGGYGTVQNLMLQSERATHLGTISDPGNSDLAITVGSTHREMPHRYGISYFSGKGPTADGRMKPDLVAPGERIVSCGLKAGTAAGDAPFCELSGTSMAAPHVSAVVAAFLSVRREFQGQPERVKAILAASATDLGRQQEFQGAGLVDAMRALQSV